MRDTWFESRTESGFPDSVYVVSFSGLRYVMGYKFKIGYEHTL